MRGMTGPTVALLATRGGSDLARSVAAFEAAGLRATVVDPLDRARACPAPRVAADDATDAFGGASVLAAVEGEAPTAALAAALAARPPAPDGVARVALRHVGRGWELEPRGGAPRYGPWGVERFGLRGVGKPARAAGRLPGALVRLHGDVESAIARLDAAADALAALLDGAGGRVGMLPTAWAAGVAGLRALGGRAPTRLGWGRWIGAALLAYADVVPYVKVVERRGRQWR